MSDRTLRGGRGGTSPRHPLLIVRGPDLAAVSADDRPADGQAEAEALRLRRDERLEDRGEPVAGDAAAAVRDRDPNPPVAIPLRPHEQPALGGRHRRHRVAAVHQEVEDHLLELDAVAAYGREIGRELRAHGHAVVREVASHDLQDLPHQLGDVEGIAMHLDVLQHEPQTLDHLTGAPVLIHDVLQDLACLVHVRLAPGQEALDGLSVAEDRRQGLVQLVGERPRQLADRRDAGEVRELAVLLEKALLRILERRDVERDAEGPRRRSPGPPAPRPLAPRSSGSGHRAARSGNPS